VFKEKFIFKTYPSYGEPPKPKDKLLADVV
jgi:hypothetical protein